MNLRMNGRTTWSFLLAGLLLMLLPIAFLFCTSTRFAGRFWATRVHFIVEDGYRGVFIIREVPSGIEVRESTDGRFVYHIPSSGVLEITNVAPLGWTRSCTAETRSGKPFPPIDWPHAEPMSEQIGFAIVSADFERAYYFLIGTERQISDKKWLMDHPIGHVWEEQCEIDMRKGH